MSTMWPDDLFNVNVSHPNSKPKAKKGRAGDSTTPPTDPLTALHRIQEDYQAARRGFREQQRDILQRTFGIAQIMKVNDGVWSGFCEEPFWSDYEGEQPEEAGQNDPWLP